MESSPIDEGRQQQLTHQGNNIQSDPQVKNEPIVTNNNNIIQQDNQPAQISENVQDDTNANNTFNQLDSNPSTNSNEFQINNSQSKERNKKRKFTQDEDEKLRELVQNHGQKQWDVIARNLRKLTNIERTPRQCRDRWKHYLSPSVSQKEWNITEDRLLLTCTQKYGAQWAALVKFFPGRTDINLKNRWNKLQRKSKKLFQTNPNVQIPKLPANPEHIHFLNPPNLILNQNQNSNQNEEIPQTLTPTIQVSVTQVTPIVPVHLPTDNNKEETQNTVLNNNNTDNLNNSYDTSNTTNATENSIPIIVPPTPIIDNNTNPVSANSTQS